MKALLHVQLLLWTALVGLAVVALALLRGSRSRRTPTVRRRRATIVVSDPAIAKLALIDHAEAFSNRPTAHFPKGFNRHHSITSVPQAGPMWGVLRRNLTAGVLHPTRLHLVAPLQQQAADALAADLLRVSTGAGAGRDGVVVVRDSLHATVFTLTARLCFGDDVGEQDVRAVEREVLHFAHNFLQDSVFFTGSAGSRMARLWHWRRWLRHTGTFDRVYKLIHPIIIAAAARKQQSRSRHGGEGGSGSPSSSYVDTLLDLDDDDDAATTSTVGSRRNKSNRRRPLSDQKMVGLAFEFLGANTETIVACVEWTLAHLVLNPEVQERLHAEIAGMQQDTAVVSDDDEQRQLLLHHRLPYLRAVILESLRLHSPVPVMRDVSAQDAAIITAAAGTPTPPASATSSDDDMPPPVVTVITDIHKIGRNSEVWTDPDEFRPERFLAGGEAEGVGPVPGPKEIRMLPFGAGQRYCPGVGIAMLRVGCILASLVREFEWALPGDSGGGDTAVDLKESRGFFTLMKTPLRARITPRPRAAALTL